jgi:hypothetical protein
MESKGNTNLEIGSLLSLQDGVNPCLEIGRYGGDRLSIPPKTHGILLEVREHWCELWGKLLFSNGIAWVRMNWVS